MKKHILIGIVILAGIGILLRHARQSHIQRSFIESPSAIAVSADNEAQIIEHNPLIKGGVKSAADLIAIVAKDKALAQFLAENGFDISCLHEEILTHALWARTSYRRGNNFYWSKHNVLISVGTHVLVDCHGNMMRMLCGNFLASVSIAAY